ncbi:MAG TPA: hypothetical protein VMV81_04815 [Phycisphaerae bacterium]|nr:hypothetical protein [Phycisphaerae bacterium]
MSGSAPTIAGGPSGIPRLPEVLTDLTERVVRGTWLWPSEKRDVRKELESHFREGLFELTQEGKSLDESVALLRDEFGDPDIAAKLIRRGKKRGRPMFWKVSVTIVLASVVLLGAGAGYVAYMTFASPTPTVDYIAKINEPTQRVAEQDRAWPLLREVTLEMLPDLGRIGQMTSLPKPGMAEWADVSELIKKERAFVPKIIEAVHKPAFGYVYGKEGADYLQRRSMITKGQAEPISQPDPLMPPTIGVLMPHLSDIRSIAKFLSLNARDLSMNGDFAAAWQSLDASHRLGVHLLGGRTLIEHLVGVATLRLATDEMRATLYQWRDRLTPQDLAMVLSSHVMIAPMDSFKPSLRDEEFFFDDVVQYVFTDDGNGNGRLIPSQFIKVASMGSEGGAGKDETSAIATAALHADRRETVAKYHDLLDRAIEYWSLPLYDPRRADGNALVEQISQNSGESKRYALISLLLPSLSRADQSMRETAQSELATRTIIGLLSYKADNQTMPARLTEIAPKYLCEVPTDIYSGMFLKYGRNDDGQATLYSVGPNLKDDGGSREKIADPSRRGQEIGADQVFWPTE